MEYNIRLVGLSQKLGERPTALHISIEEGGTLIDPGRSLWSGFVTAESFDETVKQYENPPTLTRVMKTIYCEQRFANVVDWAIKLSELTKHPQWQFDMDVDWEPADDGPTGS